jgi:hypothetical protein
LKIISSIRRQSHQQGCRVTRANRVAADCAQGGDLDAVIALLVSSPGG